MGAASQLPLFPEEVFAVKDETAEAFVGFGDFPNRERSLGFTSQWAGWWWLYLDGWWDARFMPEEWSMRSITLVTKDGRWGVYMDAVDGLGVTWTTTYWDATRDKAWRGLRFLIRNGLLRWKVKAR